MKAATPATSQAASISSSVASGRAAQRFSRSGSENSTGRCVTSATAVRRSALRSADTSIPPTRTLPLSGS